MLPLLPEKLVENSRKKQGAAPRPKFLLVDIDRCKKVNYPHLYIHPSMSVKDFNILVQKLESVLYDDVCTRTPSTAKFEEMLVQVFLFGIETFLYGNFLALKPFCTETLRFSNFLVLKLFGAEKF